MKEAMMCESNYFIITQHLRKHQVFVKCFTKFHQEIELSEPS